MSQPDICRVCGFPAEQHTIELRSGVAHTVMRGAGGKLLSCCSGASGDRHYVLGELSQMLRIVRSLRWHAGRARTRGNDMTAMALADYAGKIAAERERLLANYQQWYPWR